MAGYNCWYHNLGKHFLLPSTLLTHTPRRPFVLVSCHPLLTVCATNASDFVLHNRLSISRVRFRPSISLSLEGEGILEYAVAVANDI